MTTVEQYVAYGKIKLRELETELLFEFSQVKANLKQLEEGNENSELGIHCLRFRRMSLELGYYDVDTSKLDREYKSLLPQINKYIKAS